MPRARAASQIAIGLGLRKHEPAAAVVRVLDLDQRRRRIENVAARLHDREKLCGREQAARADLSELHAGVRGRRAGLVPHGVALAAHDDVVAGPSQRAQRDLIRHRAGRHPQRGFLAEQRRDARLQLVDGGVLAVLVVADRRARHRLAHRGRRPRDRIGAQIDWSAHGRGP